MRPTTSEPRRLRERSPKSADAAEWIWGLLMDKEQNSGNDVRRIGEVGLFSMLREKNVKELANAKFRRVLTSDPHTYNTLKKRVPGR